MRANKKPSVFTVGLTGGIASGKTTVSNLFRALNIDVIDADVIARDLVQPGETAYNAILRYFGHTVRQADGQLDRQKLRTLTFNNQQHKEWLEALLHPRVRQHMATVLAKASSPYALLVIPLLIETLPNPLIQRILVVHAPLTLRIERLMTRDHCTDAFARNIIAQQASDAARLAKADDIIENDGDIEKLKRAVAKLHAHYLSLAASA